MNRLPEAATLEAGACAYTGVEDYLDHLCLPLIKCMTFQERDIIRTEVRVHLTRLIEAHRELGAATEEATRASMRQFGDPNVIGRSLLREHRAAKHQLPLPAWMALNLMVGSVTGACVFMGIDCLMNLSHLTVNIMTGTDCLIGGAIGWLPALSQLRRGLTPAAGAARSSSIYALLVGGLSVFAAIASGHALRFWLMSLEVILTVTIAAAGLGAVAGVVNARAQRTLERFAPPSARFRRHRATS